MCSNVTSHFPGISSGETTLLVNVSDIGNSSVKVSPFFQYMEFRAPDNFANSGGGRESQSPEHFRSMSDKGPNFPHEYSDRTPVSNIQLRGSNTMYTENFQSSKGKCLRVCSYFM